MPAYLDTLTAIKQALDADQLLAALVKYHLNSKDTYDTEYTENQASPVNSNEIGSGVPGLGSGPLADVPH